MAFWALLQIKQFKGGCETKGIQEPWLKTTGLNEKVKTSHNKHCA